jgi:subtilisin family serine protease
MDSHGRIVFHPTLTRVNPSSIIIEPNLSVHDIIRNFSTDEVAELGLETIEQIEREKINQRSLLIHQKALAANEDHTKKAVAFVHKLQNKFKSNPLSNEDLDVIVRGLKNACAYFESSAEVRKILETMNSVDSVQSSSSMRLTENRFNVFEASKDGNPIFRVRINLDCTPEYVQYFKYDPDKTLKKIVWINFADEDSFKTYVNPKVKPLNVISGACSDQDQDSLKEIESSSSQLQSVIVAIYDSGIDYNHPSLASKVIRSPHDCKIAGFDCEYGTDTPYDLTEKEVIENTELMRDSYSKLKEKLAKNAGHGSGVASTVVADTKNISIFPIRSPRRLDKESKDFDAIQKASNAGSRVVNISMSSQNPKSYKSLRKAMQEFPDIFFTLSAGNYGNNHDHFPHYPSSFHEPNAITVAAHDQDGNLAKFSDYSKNSVDLAAPGVQIEVATPGGGTHRVDGTSFAAPYVARIAAKMLQINPKLSPLELKQILMETVDKRESMTDKLVSGGIVNEEKALAKAKESLGLH